MNKPNNMKGRQRGRNNGKPRPMGGGGGRNPNFDGGQRMRGNAQQLMEKYLALARDASSAGDRVLAENYFQHADHYYRVLNARFEQQQNNNGNRHQNYNQNGQGGNGQNYNQGGYDGDQQANFNDHPQGGQGGGQGGGHQQHHHHGQQQPQYQQQPQQPYQQPQQHQPQPQPQQQPEPAYAAPAAPPPAQSEDIGLPPGILGIGPPPGVPLSDNRPQGQGRSEGGEGEGRHGGGRRRRGRGDRTPANADTAE